MRNQYKVAVQESKFPFVSRALFQFYHLLFYVRLRGCLTGLKYVIQTNNKSHKNRPLRFGQNDELLICQTL